MSSGSVRVVKVALVSHVAGSLFKLVCGALTGSAALVAEALHSLMDAVNQGVLYRNAPKQGPVSGHIYSYGHGQIRHLVNLWASVGLFSIGAGLGLAWGIYRLLGEGASAGVSWMSLLAVLGALVIQGYSFTLAARLYRARMAGDGVANPFRYLRQCRDITLSVIVVQCVAGLGGLLLAGCGILASLVTQNPAWDTVAALLVALLMGWVAFYLGFLYMRYLTDVRDRNAERAFEQLVASREAVHCCHQIHSVILDDNSTWVFAEIELAQEAMVVGMLKRIAAQKRALLRKLPADKQDDTEVMAFVTARSMVEAPLNRAELIVADLEQSLREEVPAVSAVSIRVRGISPFSLPRPVKRKPLPTQNAEFIRGAGSAAG